MSQTYKFEVTPLPYAYDALEPYISETTLSFHHDKHLQTYVDNLNKALESYPQLHTLSLEYLVKNWETMPPEIRTQIRNNGGGVYNHFLYFDGMAKPGTTKPSDELKAGIEKYFKSMDGFKATMKKAALAQFGSGWAWLVCDDHGRLIIVNTPNQDTPLPEGYHPIMLVDVWEHAYYLDYQNRRADYFDNWYDVINWEMASHRYSVYCKCQNCNG